MPNAKSARWLTSLDVDGVADSLALAKRIVTEAGVGLAPGAAFGKGDQRGFLRLCFAQALELLARAMERLKRVIV